MNEQIRRIMVEIDEAAGRLIGDEAYCRSLGTPDWPASAAGPIRLTVGSAPSVANGRKVFHLAITRERADQWRDWCAAHADILNTYPDQREREYGAVLDRAARHF